jgi:SAM-dependent methyltransferase
MNQFFSLQEAARRYDQFRPKTHNVVVDWLADCFGTRRWKRGIDIACGTGDSTVPLLQICDRVIGIDSSPEMLRFAESKGLTTRVASYDELDEEGTYDLISTCMAFHWFDPAKALAVYKRISSPGATWIIYNFAFGGHESSDEVNGWFREYYLKTYPSPPRNRSALVIPDDDAQIELLKQQKGVIPIEFTPESLVGYLSTQSNIEAAVKDGGSYDAICDDLLNRIGALDISGHFRYRYTYGIYQEIYAGRKVEVT